MDPAKTLSAATQKYWIHDFVAKQTRIILQDGSERAIPIEASETLLNSEIGQTVLDWENWRSSAFTRRGDHVDSEVYRPNSTGTSGRPTVYLDQNHWSTVAKALTQPERVPRPEDVEAAKELCHLAEDGGIIVPLSSAHLRETAPLGGELRYAVGVTMARLSAGWQLRHPNHVWRNEATNMIADELRLNRPQFSELPVTTLEPHAFLDDDTRAYAMDSRGTELFILAMSSSSVTLELLLGQGREAKPIDEWVAMNQRRTDDIAESELNVAQRRRQAWRYAWMENSDAIRHALSTLGIATSDIAHIMERAIPRMLQSQPMVSYFCELLVRRYVDQSVRWKSNDLTDMMFLSTAAGYADYVAAERHIGTQLIQLQRSRRVPVTVHLTLPELVNAIRSDGVRTISERQGA